MEYLSERFAPGPLFGWLCIVFAGLLPMVWLHGRRFGRLPRLRFSSIDLLESLGPTFASRTRVVIPLLRSATIAALIIALARPQSGGAYKDTRQGIAIQMVLDVSGSMAEEDFLIKGSQARRLDAVKTVFEDFVLGRGALRGRDGDLIGMTTFAMFADTPCPLTLDHGSLGDLLEQTEIPGWIDGRQVREDAEAGNTSLGDAIVVATDVLRRAGEQAAAGVPGAEAAKSRVMILLTDGQDNPPDFAKRTAPNPIEAARLAATLGIRVYTIGAVGSDELRRRGGYGLFGRPRAQVDEATLKEIARVSGGKYFRATDTQSLVTIYDEIDKLERTETGERVFRDDVYACKVAMLTGLALLLAELLLANTRYRRVP